MIRITFNKSLPFTPGDVLQIDTIDLTDMSKDTRVVATVDGHQVEIDIDMEVTLNGMKYRVMNLQG